MTKKLLERKIQVLQEILNLTSSTAFTESEKDVDTYINLVENRESLVNEARHLDEQIGELGIANEEFLHYNEKIKELAYKIIEQDNYMADSVIKTLTQVKNSIKNVKNSRVLNSAYSDTHGRRSNFDWTK